MKIIIAVLLLLCSLAHAAKAAPTLGANCGTGATIVGSEKAGKIIVGDQNPDTGFVGCTLTFSWPKVPSCSAMNETNDPGPAPLGTITTTTSLFISDTASQVPSVYAGHVISYLCVGQ